MPISNFPNGFSAGVNIRGVPILNTYPGNIYWVDSNAGSDGNKGTFDRPFASIDYAIGRCTANNGDIIFPKSGHAETLATASAITADVAGVSIIGLGAGADRPSLTFSATDSTLVVSAASVTIQNIIIKPSIDSVVSPIVISGTDAWIDVEHQDASAAVEAVRSILTTATADRLHIDLKYRGFIAGNACVNAIRLVGTDSGDINVDFYGVASTAVVEFHTTACHNITVNGEFYNSGTTDLSKNVVDTATGSTWFTSGYDAAAGQSFSGGSGGAIAGDDVGAIASLIGTANLTTTDNLHGKIGTDTEMADNSLYDLLGAGSKTLSISSAIGSSVDGTTTDTLHGKIGTDTEMADNSLYDLLGAGAKTLALSTAIGSDVDGTTTDTLHGKIGTDTEMADSSLYDLLGAGSKTLSISDSVGASVDGTTTDTLHGKIGTDTEMADNSLYDLIGAGSKTLALSTAIGSDIDGATTDTLHGKLGTDTELADRSIFDQLVGDGPASAPAAAVAGNDVSIYEVLRYVHENQSGRWASKVYADLTGYDTAAAFTVTGDVMVRVVGVVGATGITSTSGTTTLAVGTTEATGSILAASTIDNTQFAATDVWVDSTPSDDSEIMTQDWVIIGGGADIILTRSVDDITAGTLTLYLEWKPLSSDGAVVAA